MKNGEENQKIRAIWEIKTWIRGHIDAPMPLEMLAARSGMSLRSFNRYFLQVAGESPAGHIQRIRLALGAACLAYSKASVIEAAMAAGYESREAFTRLFHKHYGCTPREFRARLRDQISALADQPRPAGLHILGIQELPKMWLLAYPHFGTTLSMASAWVCVGRHARKHNLLQNTRPVTVIYDDPTVLVPGARERFDATLAFTSPEMPEPDNGYIHCKIPGGAFAIADFKGSIADLDAAWDYFALVWFINSGFQMRDFRCFVLHEPRDIPTGPVQAARLLAGKKITCKLCIPADTVPGAGLPVLEGVTLPATHQTP